MQRSLLHFVVAHAHADARLCTKNTLCSCLEVRSDEGFYSSFNVPIIKTVEKANTIDKEQELPPLLVANAPDFLPLLAIFIWLS